jgi:DNA-binding NarL/FixJ family response regulator
MASVLGESGHIAVIGERDFSNILTVEEPPEELYWEVAVVAHRLVTEYGLSVVAHLKTMMPESFVLVHGDYDSLETAAQLMAAGASGFFDMSDPAGYLSNAVMLVSQSKLWGPREAVALMAQRVIERGQRQPVPQPATNGDGLSAEDKTILQLLNEGLSNKEIGSRLGIAEVTVKSRFGRLYRRFGVTTRLQLLTAAMRKGLLSATDVGPTVQSGGA